jgi:molybdopterin-guanine dinucleotide biosynthesis protein A
VGGADKGRIPWAGSTLVEQVLSRIAPQVDDIVVSANRHRDWYLSLGHPVIADKREGYQGPLAGVEAALPLCRHAYSLVVACDTPALPHNLVERLAQALAKSSSDVCYASDGERNHYLAALWKTNLRETLIDYLDSTQRSVNGFYKTVTATAVNFPGSSDCFENVNRTDPRP